MIARAPFPGFVSTRRHASAFLRCLVVVCIAMVVLTLAACDPVSLIRAKVPEPIQDFLQFTPQAKTAPGPAGVPEGPKMDIVQPVSNSVHPSGQDVLFQAAVSVPPGQSAQPLELDWTLFKDKEPRPIPVGKGHSVKKALEAGNYRVELSVNYQGQRMAKAVPFRVIYAVTGKVVTPDGKGLPGTEMSLSDLAGKNVISRAQSDRDGGFTLEIPAEGHYLVMPQKEGFGFNPFHRLLRYEQGPHGVQFVGVKGEIKDVTLTASQTSDQILADLCPLQEGWVKFTVQGEIKPTRVEAFLVHIVENEERSIAFDEVKAPGPGDSLASTGTPEWLHVRVPAELRGGAKEVKYHLALTVRDEHGNLISTQGSGEISVNLANCFARRLTESVALHEKGDLSGAINSYDSMEDMYRKLMDPTPFVSVVEKIHFNRGIARLNQALSSPRESRNFRETLGKALSDFNSVLKTRRKDAQALLMRGVVKGLIDDRDSAKEDFTSVLALEPGKPLVLELRARELLATKVKKNLIPALDDLTEAIALDPANEELRKTRRETLKLIVQTQDEKEDATVDTSKLPLGEIERILKPEGYLRK
jgi:hypothetical protein